MKHLLGIIFFSFLFILPAGHAYAETSVDIENNGDGASSDVHVENSVGNGANTTTVCINGKCETTQGNVDRQEGGAKVKIENNPSAGSGQAPIMTMTPTPTPKKEASNSAQKKVSQQQQMSLEEMINNFKKFLFSLIQQGK